VPLNINAAAAHDDSANVGSMKWTQKATLWAALVAAGAGLYLVWSVAGVLLLIGALAIGLRFAWQWWSERGRERERQARAWARGKAKSSTQRARRSVENAERHRVLSEIQAERSAIAGQGGMAINAGGNVYVGNPPATGDREGLKGALAELEEQSYSIGGVDRRGREVLERIGADLLKGRDSFLLRQTVAYRFGVESENVDERPIIQDWTLAGIIERDSDEYTLSALGRRVLNAFIRPGAQ
jgi:hypothetical protein